MDLRTDPTAVQPVVRPSPLAGFEHGPGHGVYCPPARPVCAVGRAHFEMRNRDAYRRTVAELQRSQACSAEPSRGRGT